MPKWALGYEDGRVIFGDTEVDELVPVMVPRKWLEAPADGVIGMAVENPVTGRVIYEGKDCFYWMAPPHPGAGEPGTADRLGAYLRAQGIVKFGIWVNSASWPERFMRFRAAVEEHIPTDRVAADRMHRVGERGGPQED